jgi:plasmid stabilization system protein ParE
MDIYRVVWSNGAAIRRLNIGQYILEQLHNRIAAARVAKTIKDAANILAQSPYRGRVAVPRQGLRRLNVKDTNYFMLYTVDERRKLVTIMYVFHSKENWLKKI